MKGRARKSPARFIAALNYPHLLRCRLASTPYAAVHRLASDGTSKGVVRQVAAWALEQCPNLRIDIHRDNLVMQNALARAGCTRCGIIYLPDGDPRIAYQKVRE